MERVECCTGGTVGENFDSGPAVFGEDGCLYGWESGVLEGLGGGVA